MLVVLSFGAFAQQTSEQPGRKTNFVTNGFWDNWFFGAGAGANLYLSKGLSDGPFFKQPTLTVNGQVGKWFTPYLGLRGQGTFGSLHTFNYEGSNNIMATQKLMTVQLNAMFDVTNYLMGYNSSRFYHFIIFGGAGGGAGWDAKLHGKGTIGESKQFFTLNGGIIQQFRIIDPLSVDLEIGASAIPSDLKRIEGSKHRYQGLLNVSLGLTYNFGNSKNSATSIASNVDGRTYGFAPFVDQALDFDKLNSELEALRRRNAILEQRPEYCPECPKPAPVPVPTSSTFVSNVVFFKLNSSVIDASQQVSIYNTAQYMKDNTSAKVRVVGYADKDTGTASYNEKISERRAKAVADTLIKKYGISSDRVIVEWKGSSVQPYPQNNAWNRVAIFYAD